MSYEEKLKNPLWQKKRLEIMSRDNFSCKVCGCGIKNGTPLNVHHLKYLRNTDPWDYDNNLLITLCEECHRKIHNKEIAIQFNVPEKGFVFYKVLFNERQILSASACMIYSVFLHRQYTNNKFKSPNIEHISNSELSKITGISKRNIIIVKQELFNKGYICDNNIKIPNNIQECGYLRVPIDTDLSGWQLVFYAFLKERCDYFGGSIDTWSSRLAELFGTTSDNIRKLISILTQKGYITRNDSGNLTIKVRERIKPDSPPLAKVIPNYKEYACKDNAFY